MATRGIKLYSRCAQQFLPALHGRHKCMRNLCTNRSSQRLHIFVLLLYTVAFPVDDDVKIIVLVTSPIHQGDLVISIHVIVDIVDFCYYIK